MNFRECEVKSFQRWGRVDEGFISKERIREVRDMDLLGSLECEMQQ